MNINLYSHQHIYQIVNFCDSIIKKYNVFTIQIYKNNDFFVHLVPISPIILNY